ncbi:MAG TPA: hypothetical protein VKT49_16980 [Bryobacteraceae bacterium]|nr:hypothetical protein [Bryobacteraceae bacterium]
MNAVATLPSSGTGDVFGTGGYVPAKAAQAGEPPELSLAALFPALLGDLLEADTEPGPEPGKKREDATTDAVAPAVIPIPAELARLPLSAPASDTTQAIDSPLPNHERATAALAPPLREAGPAQAVPPAATGRALAAELSMSEAPSLPVDPAVLSLQSDTPATIPLARASSPTPPVSEVLQSLSSGPAPVSDQLVAGTEIPSPTRDPKRSADLTLISTSSNVTVDLPVVDLPAAHLPAVDLPAPDLPKADLPAADLPKADLSKTDLPAADLPAPGRPSQRPPAEVSVPSGPNRNPGVQADEGAASRPAELAFAARLRPVGNEPMPQSGMTPPSRSAPGQAAVGRMESVRGTDPAAPQPESRPITPLTAPPVARPSAASEQARSEPRRSESPLPAPQAAAALESTPSATRQERAAPGAEPRHPAVAPPHEPAAPALAARDIRLQVHGGEQRVNLRLIERRGAVEVAVRTPDPRLAEALRGELPALSARLEQSGIRAETWYPAALRSEHYGFGPEPAPAGPGPQSEQGQRHGKQQDQQSPARRGPQADAENPSEAPLPEFSWLFTSLR